MSPLRYASLAKLRLSAIKSAGLLAVLLVATLQAYGATFPCTTSSLIRSAQSGLLASPSTWVGGSVPTDGNCVVIRHHVTLNSDLGSEGGTGLGWIRIENGATLDADCAAPHTIYFGSTGTNPIGSGSNLNPGADASMFGFFVSYGSLNLACAQPNNISVTSANENHPWYIHHQSGDYSGCTAISNNICNGIEGFHGAVLNLQHTALNHVGTSVLYFNGIDWDMTSLRTPPNSLTFSYNWVRDLYGIVADGNSFQANGWTVAFNWFDAPRPDLNRGLLYFYSTPTNWTIADNTVTHPATSSYLLNAPHNGTGTQVLRNAVLGTPEVPFAIANTQAANGHNNSYNYNLCINPEPSQAARVACFMIASGNGDSGTTASYNVIQGGHSGISQVGTSTFNPTFSYNWISQWKEDSNGQGAIITRTGTVTEIYNVLVMENSSSTLYMIGNLGYTSSNNSCNATVQQDHNTLYGVSNPMGNPNINFLWGDGLTSPHTCVVNSYVRSNIAYGTNLGMVNENNDNTWNLSSGIAYGGAAVHHNLVYAASRAYYLNTQTTPGFDNGLVHHPNQAQYGDLTVDPRFYDTTRRPGGYDAVCGGPGTNENLFLNLSMRSGFGGIYNSCYNIPALSTWVRQGWAPRNTHLMGAAHDGTFIGALPPVGGSTD
jgi:hypothetical protein